ncbi:hypothetical protein A6S26_07510 [Nostoc sp. ATCC 43529]|nr:hypothetical protein A6S26_07510 [Nostoc sp. ATCC 43529]
MHSEINAITNIVEMYDAFLDWVFFGKEGAITENDPKDSSANGKCSRGMGLTNLGRIGDR